MLTYGQKTSQDVSYMTSWDETVLLRQMCCVFSVTVQLFWSAFEAGPQGGFETQIQNSL